MAIHLNRYKKDFKYSYSLGVFPTIELLQNQHKHTESVIFHSKGRRNQGLDKIRLLCEKHNIPLEEDDKAIHRIARKGNIYAIGVFKKYHLPLDRGRNHVVLVNPSGMGNLGTIMRSMLGFGKNDLAIIEPAADYYNPKVIRASMGAIFQLRVETFDAFTDYWGKYASHTLYPMMTGGKIGLDKVRFQSPYAILFGNESSGLPQEYKQFGTDVRIPQDDAAIDSLNLATSVGIALYQTWIRSATEG